MFQSVLLPFIGMIMLVMSSDVHNPTFLAVKCDPLYGCHRHNNKWTVKEKLTSLNKFIIKRGLYHVLLAQAMVITFSFLFPSIILLSKGLCYSIHLVGVAGE